jgi:hypothetical protein
MSKPQGLLGGLAEIQAIMKEESLDWDAAHDVWLDRRAPIISNVIKLDDFRRRSEHVVD